MAWQIWVVVMAKRNAMKRRYLTILGLVAAGAAASARLMHWAPSHEPKLSMVEAYGLASAALGQQTNEFYCVRAECIIARSSNGEWLFTFGSKTGGVKSAFVFFDKRTQIEDGVPAF